MFRSNPNRVSQLRNKREKFLPYFNFPQCNSYPVGFQYFFCAQHSHRISTNCFEFDTKAGSEQTCNELTNNINLKITFKETWVLHKIHHIAHVTFSKGDFMKGYMNETIFMKHFGTLVLVPLGHPHVP